MGFQLVPKLVTLNDIERRNCPYFAWFLRNLVILRAYCVKVVDSHNYGPFTITMSSSKRLQRDRATPTVEIPSRLINSRLNAQYWPSYRFDNKSYMRLRLVQISVTLNDQLKGEMAFLLHYFTEFDSVWGALPKSGWQSHNYGQFTITVY